MSPRIACGKTKRRNIGEILLVDDALDYLWLVRSLLVQAGMAVQLATSGEEALWKLNENTFDLMITDWNMPGMGGLSLTRQANIIAPNMSIIMITGSISSDIPRLAAEAGIAKVLTKPFKSEELLKTIKTVREKCLSKVLQISN